MIITKLERNNLKRSIILNRNKITSNNISQILPIIFTKLSFGYDNTQFKLSKCKIMYAFL